MPRRRVSKPDFPKRPDPRRGNGVGAQRQQTRRAGVGGAERIATRRARALELRMSGLSYRAVAGTLGIDVHTAFGDVAAELFDLREQIVQNAADLREMELQRCDAMLVGLWPAIGHGDAKAVNAAIRVSERRARLLGLDAPVSLKTTQVTDMEAPRRTVEQAVLDCPDVATAEKLVAALDAHAQAIKEHQQAFNGLIAHGLPKESS